jgi:hypothetical protein
MNLDHRYVQVGSQVAGIGFNDKLLNINAQPPRMFSGKKNSGGGSVPTSLQSVTERLRRLPCLFIADMGIAHGRADILVAEQFLDFPQILSHVVEEDRRRAVAQSVRGNLTHPERSASGPESEVERPV